MTFSVGGRIIASGIAEFDVNTKEGVIEWCKFSLSINAKDMENGCSRVSV